jgi:signal transduction histidine kinase
MLGSFIAAHRDEIIARCRAKVAVRSVPVPNQPDEDYGVPLFLDQLIEALRLGVRSNPEIGESAIQHGRELLRKGFTMSQVVHDYGDVCQSVTEMATEMSDVISSADFCVLNRCLDEAIAGAVTEYGRQRDQSTVDVAAARGAGRLEFLAHELRNLLNTAILSFEVLRTGNVGIAGSTGSVLHHSLLGLRALIGRSLAEVRLTQGIQNLDRIQLFELVDEVVAAAGLHAETIGPRLTVLPVDQDIAIQGDRQVLAAVVGNLLQNAFKFTRSQTTVTLRVRASAERVLIEIEDECGGLTDANHDDLVRPFEQRSRDRTGLGLGLAFSRWGVEANHGRIYARNKPERGCVFTVDLPRLVEPELAMNVDSESRPRLVASIVQDDAEQGVVDPDRALAFVVDEAQLPELVQEKVHP